MQTEKLNFRFDRDRRLWEAQASSSPFDPFRGPFYPVQILPRGRAHYQVRITRGQDAQACRLNRPCKWHDYRGTGIAVIKKHWAVRLLESARLAPEVSET